MVMSSGLKEKENFYNGELGKNPKKVNLTDLVGRMNTEKAKEKKRNVIISAAAISAVTVFGIILTL
tara:strand:+ start:796 stop:993 length:198 start_codon:yes stop_codon:yes gene_type:complete